MYVPRHFAVDDATVRDLLTRHGAADLVTTTADGLAATMLPFVLCPTVGEHGALLGHMARHDSQWRTSTGPALVIARGPDAYVTPSNYATKAERGRVVPTWSYVTGQVHGDLVVHGDAGWVRHTMQRLTSKHEKGRQQPWSVDDAPAGRAVRSAVGARGIDGSRGCRR